MFSAIWVAALLAGSACGGQSANATTDTLPPPQAATTREPALTPEDRAFYREVAKTAWAYLDSYYQPATGFVNATPDWANTTVWDLGGQLIAYHAAKELGLLPRDEFLRRTRRTLETLERVELFRGAAYNKLYSTKDGSIGRSRLGWSATDLGRLLVGLKILSVHEPELAPLAEKVARRNNFSQIVKNGYVHGQLIGSKGKPWTFQEGRIGYEQYVAAGFHAWGADVERARAWKRNAAKPIAVHGIELPRDRRYQDRLLSEPFILHGIELGFDADMGDLASRVLRAQEQRYRATGKVTVASEDAVSVAPHYFYYYCVLCNGKPFVVDVSSPGHELNTPRWVSTKATFGWHALMPSEYTAKAMAFVAAARDPKRGWASGVFEDTGASTKTWDINTAAVLLEVAFYQLRGRVPLIQPASVAAP